VDKAELIQQLWNLREKLRGTVGMMDEDLNIIRDAMEAIDQNYLKFIP
jgi:hypothetical protein